MSNIFNDSKFLGLLSDVSNNNLVKPSLIGSTRRSYSDGGTSDIKMTNDANKNTAIIYDTVRRKIQEAKASGRLKEGENLNVEGIVAQILQESGNGKSSLVRNNNNFGGLKNGTKGWQKFPSVDAGLQAQIDLFLTPRYKKVLTATTPKEHLEYSVKSGYNSEPGYVKGILPQVSSMPIRFKKAGYDPNYVAPKPEPVFDPKSVNFIPDVSDREMSMDDKMMLERNPAYVDLTKKQKGGSYNNKTKLSPDKEVVFQQWFKSLPQQYKSEDPNSDSYDYRGQWLENEGDFFRQPDGYHMSSRASESGKYLKYPNDSDSWFQGIEGDIREGYAPMMNLRTGQWNSQKVKQQGGSMSQGEGYMRDKNLFQFEIAGRNPFTQKEEDDPMYHAPSMLNELSNSFNTHGDWSKEPHSVTTPGRKKNFNKEMFNLAMINDPRSFIHAMPDKGIFGAIKGIGHGLGTAAALYTGYHGQFHLDDKFKKDKTVNYNTPEKVNTPVNKNSYNNIGGLETNYDPKNSPSFELNGNDFYTEGFGNTTKANGGNIYADKQHHMKYGGLAQFVVGGPTDPLQPELSMDAKIRMSSGDGTMMDKFDAMGATDSRSEEEIVSQNKAAALKATQAQKTPMYGSFAATHPNATSYFTKEQVAANDAKVQQTYKPNVVAEKLKEELNIRKHGRYLAETAIAGLKGINKVFEVNANASEYQKRMRNSGNTNEKYTASNPENPFGNYTPNQSVGAGARLATLGYKQDFGTTGIAAKNGGSVNRLFEAGGEYDVTQEELEYIKANGGQFDLIEYKQEGGPTVSQLWKEKTGLEWSEAKKKGLTSGSFQDNMNLHRRLQQDDFNINNLQSAKSTTSNIPEYNDDEFSTAFSKARNKQGSNSSFKWNGNIYGTKLKGENVSNNIPVKQTEQPTVTPQPQSKPIVIPPRPVPQVSISKRFEDQMGRKPIPGDPSDNKMLNEIVAKYGPTIVANQSIVDNAKQKTIKNTQDYAQRMSDWNKINNISTNMIKNTESRKAVALSKIENDLKQQEKQKQLEAKQKQKETVKVIDIKKPTLDVPGYTWNGPSSTIQSSPSVSPTKNNGSTGVVGTSKSEPGVLDKVTDNISELYTSVSKEGLINTTKQLWNKISNDDDKSLPVMKKVPVSATSKTLKKTDTYDYEDIMDKKAVPVDNNSYVETYVKKLSNTNNLKVRNRGDDTDVKGDPLFYSYAPFKTFSEQKNKRYAALDLKFNDANKEYVNNYDVLVLKNGSLKSGKINDFKNDNTAKISPTWKHNEVTDFVIDAKNPKGDTINQPMLGYKSKDGSIKYIPIGLGTDGKGTTVSTWSGGHLIIENPKTKEVIVLHGSAQDLKQGVDNYKLKNKIDSINILETDHKNYAVIKKNKNKLYSKDYNITMDNLNSAQSGSGNLIYQ